MRELPYRPFQQRPKAGEWRWLEYAEPVPILGRDGSPLWKRIKKLGMGADRAAVAFGFAASEEREGQHVQANYQKYLGRSAGPDEVAYWVDQFAHHGQTNEDVITGFTSSDEYFREHTAA